MAEDMRRDGAPPREPMDPVAAARAAQKDFKQKLRENKRKLKAARDAAPSLMGRLKIESAKDKARAAALRKVAEAVYGTSKADWQAVAADVDIFDAEDKAFLDIADDEFDEADFA